jgi:YEATS domain-containing protein 4
MADGVEGNARRKGITITKPIVYGNVARYFGKKRDDDGHTHAWTCYLKPFKSEDMSIFIKKVQFKLHESYPNPLRIVSRPPYEVQETGWGEFEIIIKVFFQDSAEKPVTIYHLLKLFQTDPAVIAGKKNVISEHYDEMVFTDPTNTMYNLLSNPRQLIPAVRHDNNIDYREMEEKHLTAILSAQKKIKLEIQDLSERLKMNKELIQKYKDHLGDVEEEEEMDERE